MSEETTSVSICENCGKEHDGSYGSGRFCSCKCARCFSTKANREEINKKVSQTLLKRRDQGFLKTSFKKTDFTIRYCSDCGKQISFKNKSGYCRKCIVNTDEWRSKQRVAQREAQLKLIKEGRHKGWASRNIKSYPEKFFELVLNNNEIEYTREKKVGKYFLDFVIGKVDLEIDGKQHKYKDRAEHDAIRDQYLTECGYIVYRIDWNEINSEVGKQTMKLKINRLLEFLSTI